MHLVELLLLRAVPAAGVSLALTRRCPLSCAHCSTESTLQSEEGSAALFVGFVESFTVEDHPQVMALSGGEAFLRPALVQELAERAAEVGCAATALSGMFWAEGGRIPPAIARALEPLAHFSVSLDVFHEREVRREDVFRVLERLVADGKDVSVHVTGLDERDGYLAERTAEISARFAGGVPMLVNGVNAVGRAASWMEADADEAPALVEANPCTLAAWPLVAFDGTIVACGNDDVVNGPAPAHLRLGHAAADGWPEIRARSLGSSALRAIRTFGPQYVAERFAEGEVACSGYCTTCQRLAGHPALDVRLAAAMARPSAALLESQVVEISQAAGAAAFARRYAMAAYADLVTLGAPA